MRRDRVRACERSWLVKSWGDYGVCGGGEREVSCLNVTAAAPSTVRSCALPNFKLTSKSSFDRISPTPSRLFHRCSSMDDTLEIFVSQVAGSLPMLRDGRRGRVLKPAMEHELSFYVAIRDAPPASVAPILRFLPLFFGTKRVGLRDLRGLAQKCQDETFVRSQVQRDRQQREATVLGR